MLVKLKLSLVNLDNEESLDEINKNLCYQHLVHYTSDLTTKSPEKFSDQLSTLFQLNNRTSELKKPQQRSKMNSTTNEAEKQTNNNHTINTQQPFDPIIYLITNKICASIDIYHDNFSSDLTIFDLIVLLESALASNSYDFYCKLFLIRLYNSIGAVFSSHALYETLDIKLIQNDTLGYFFLFPFLTSGLFSIAQPFLNSSSKFYSFNFKEVHFIYIYFKNYFYIIY